MTKDNTGSYHLLMSERGIDTIGDAMLVEPFAILISTASEEGSHLMAPNPAPFRLQTGRSDAVPSNAGPTHWYWKLVNVTGITFHEAESDLYDCVGGEATDDGGGE